MDTIVILSNEKTVDKLKKATSKFGVDFDLIVGKDTALQQTDGNWTEDQAAVSRLLLKIH